MQTVSIIIPVYNEEKRINKTIEEVINADTLGMNREIIIVDDGSSDGTVYNVKSQMLKVKNKDQKLKVIFIERKINEGKGAALKAGFEKATGDILMVQDGDLEYFVKDYPVLLKPFIKNEAQIVYGSRNKAREKYGTSYSYLSFYWGGILLTWIVNILFGIHLSDQATGYKIFSKKIKYLLLKPNENRFSYEVALTATLAKEKIPFVEVPIHYQPRSIKEGKKIDIMDFIDSVIVAVKYKIVL